MISQPWFRKWFGAIIRYLQSLSATFQELCKTWPFKLDKITWKIFYRIIFAIVKLQVNKIKIWCYIFFHNWCSPLQFVFFPTKNDSPIFEGSLQICKSSFFDSYPQLLDFLQSPWNRAQRSDKWTTQHSNNTKSTWYMIFAIPYT